MERLQWVDRMRGIAMFSVVVQHMTNSFPNDFVYQKLIAISNMAVFFFVSGYIIHTTAKITDFKGIALFVWKKTQQLLIPLAVWGLLVNNYFFKAQWSLLSVQDLLNEWHRPSLWFLLTLFAFMLWYALYRLFSLKVKLGGARIIYWIVAIAMNALLWKKTGEFGTSLNYLPYFALGVIVSEIKGINYLKNKYLSMIALPVVFLLTAFWSSGAMSVMNVGIKFVVSIAVIIVVYCVSTEIKWNTHIDKFINMCGVNSLAIYCVHRFFTNIWMPNIAFTNNEFLALLYATSLAIILCYLCVFFKRAVRLYPVVDFILFGTRKTNQ